MGLGENSVVDKLTLSALSLINCLAASDQIAGTVITQRMYSSPGVLYDHNVICKDTSVGDHHNIL